MGGVTQGRLAVSGRGGPRSQASRTQSKVFSDSACTYPAGRKRKPEDLPPAHRPAPPPQDHPVLHLGTMPIQLTPPSHHSTSTRCPVCTGSQARNVTLHLLGSFAVTPSVAHAALRTGTTTQRHSPSLGHIAGSLSCQVPTRGAVIPTAGRGVLSAAGKPTTQELHSQPVSPKGGFQVCSTLSAPDPQP